MAFAKYPGLFTRDDDVINDCSFETPNGEDDNFDFASGVTQAAETNVESTNSQKWWNVAFFIILCIVGFAAFEFVNASISDVMQEILKNNKNAVSSPVDDFTKFLSIVLKLL